ncbi:hypothetical protein [Streptomyces sp. A0592]|nr:hypothetical protein [Streptomyces sp. A0592]
MTTASTTASASVVDAPIWVHLAVMAAAILILVYNLARDGR